ncbi:hypothetical protein [Indioceanicola profundi]|uniref:hypothetical protein n=1 Tax=Indioceanicola profundi TaxID=2220096 RepID=UPI0013C46ABC|nr:hypothetical protein [Indioceanicola profundi]
MTAAAMTVASTHTTTPYGVPSPVDAPATGIAASYGADKLAAQIQEALARCRRLGHREPNVTLTRPTSVVLAVEGLLQSAGLAVRVVPARIGGCSVLTVRG